MLDYIRVLINKISIKRITDLSSAKAQSTPTKPPVASVGVETVDLTSLPQDHADDRDRESPLEASEVFDADGFDPATFDAAFYLAENGDVREAGIDPLAHYLADGCREGRFPSLAAKRRASSLAVSNLYNANDKEGVQHISDERFVVSIITPTYNTQKEYLEELSCTIRNQIFSNWEWILVDDGSSRGETLLWLKSIEGSDHRISVKFLKSNSGISAASNTAIALARGTHIALVDHDDLLAREALLQVYRQWLERPETDLFYTDECKLMADGTLGWFWAKPDWSPAYLESTMYIGHLSVYERTFVVEMGGFRSRFDGTQDYDLALRASLRDPVVTHIPYFAYIWRIIPGSAALDVDEKHYTVERQREAVLEYARRKDPTAFVRARNWPGYWHAIFSPPYPQPLLTIIVYANHTDSFDDDLSDVASCIRNIDERLSYSNTGFIAIIPGDAGKDDLHGLMPAARQIRVVRYDPERISVHSKVNEAVASSDGVYICVVHLKVRIITPDSGASIIGLMCRNSKVGIVSPIFLTTDGHVWQNGTVLTSTGPRRAAQGQLLTYDGPNNLLKCRRENFGTMDGMFIISRKAFDKVGGFNTSISSPISELDLSVRVRGMGFSCLVDPCVEVHRGDGFGRDLIDEIDDALWRSLYPDAVDPYFSKWYGGDFTDFIVKFKSQPR